MDVTVQPESSLAREYTDFSNPELTSYNVEFDLVSSSNLNFESFSHLPPEICCTFCPETKQQLMITDALKKCKNWNEKVMLCC